MLMIEQEGQHNNYSLHLTNDISQVACLASWVENICNEAHMAPDSLFNINLAVEEAVANVMNYAYGNLKSMPIDLEAEVAPEKLRITIKDEGMAFDPTSVADPDLSLPVEERPIGGLGIMLVRKLTKELVYKRENNCNYLTLIF